MEETISSRQVKAEAQRLGFYACGLAPAGPLEETYANRVRQWIAEKKNGDMAYLANNLEKRLNPRLLVEGAETIVSVALNYYTGAQLSPSGYAFARYAQGADYHDIVREKLRRLLAALRLEEHTDGRVFCDTAPVDERYWAMRCGLGWNGRSGQLIIPGAGSYFFLGELILTHKADAYDRPAISRCGSCNRCIAACPTGALLGDGTLDARRCLSYLTIEHRGDIAPETAQRMGHCIYGCDRCSEACPWNRFALPTAEPRFLPSPELRNMTTADWHGLTVEQYRKLFKGSAVKRAKYEGLLRNIQAVENTTRRHPSASQASAPHPGKPKAETPQEDGTPGKGDETVWKA